MLSLLTLNVEGFFLQMEGCSKIGGLNNVTNFHKKTPLPESPSKLHTGDLQLY